MLRKYVCALSVGVLLLSCNELDKIESPSNFNVTMQKDTYNVGEIVNFEMTGNPDVISFYTGEMGHNYDFIDGRIANPKFLLSFESQRLDGLQVNNKLSVLVSTNFDGTKTYEGVNNPKNIWTDLTDQFTFPADGDRSANLKSGDVDISNLLDKDATDVYIAFKHKATDPGTSPLNIIRVKKPTITSTYETLSSKIFQYDAADWTMFSSENKDPNKAFIKANMLEFRPNSGAQSKKLTTYDWAVVGPITLNKTQDFGPDRAIGIKGVNDIFANKYQYVFDNPGAYKVVFRAQNINADDQKEKFITLNVNIIQ